MNIDDRLDDVRNVLHMLIGIRATMAMAAIREQFLFLKRSNGQKCRRDRERMEGEAG